MAKIWKSMLAVTTDMEPREQNYKKNRLRYRIRQKRM